MNTSQWASVGSGYSGSSDRLNDAAEWVHANGNGDLFLRVPHAVVVASMKASLLDHVVATLSLDRNQASIAKCEDLAAFFDYVRTRYREIDTKKEET